MPADFGTLLKVHRLRRGFGLREFADLIGDQPSNYCGVETGRRKPWQTREKVRRAAEALSLREGSPEWDEFFVAAGQFSEVEEILGRPLVPALLRTIDQARLSDEKLRSLIDDLRSGKYST